MSEIPHASQRPPMSERKAITVIMLSAALSQAKQSVSFLNTARSACTDGKAVDEIMELEMAAQKHRDKLEAFLFKYYRMQNEP